MPSTTLSASLGGALLAAALVLAPTVPAHAAEPSLPVVGGSGALIENSADDLPFPSRESTGEILTYAVVSPPRHGTAVITGPTASTITYTPDRDFSGTDSFTFTVSDGVSTSAPDAMDLTVLGGNDYPVARDASVTTAPGTAVPVQLVGTAGDRPLAYTVVGGPSHGTLTGSGTMRTYTPVAGFVGTDSFVFTVTDGTLTSDIGTVSIRVGGAGAAPPTGEHAPVAAGLSFSTPAGHPFAVVLPGTDEDAGDTLGYRITAQPAHGELIGSGGYRVYRPDASYVGADRFTYTVTDGRFTSLPATVDVTVAASARGEHTPVPIGQLLSTARDTPLGIVLQGSDTDGDPLRFATAAQPGHGTLSGAGARVTYTPAPGFTGADSFTFTVDDGMWQSAPETVIVTVGPYTGPWIPTPLPGTEELPPLPPVLEFPPGAPATPVPDNDPTSAPPPAPVPSGLPRWIDGDASSRLTISGHDFIDSEPDGTTHSFPVGADVLEAAASGGTLSLTDASRNAYEPVDLSAEFFGPAGADGGLQLGTSTLSPYGTAPAGASMLRFSAFHRDCSRQPGSEDIRRFDVAANGDPVAIDLTFAVTCDADTTDVMTGTLHWRAATAPAAPVPTPAPAASSITPTPAPTVDPGGTPLPAATAGAASGAGSSAPTVPPGGVPAGTPHPAPTPNPAPTSHPAPAPTSHPSSTARPAPHQRSRTLLGRATRSHGRVRLTVETERAAARSSAWKRWGSARVRIEERTAHGWRTVTTVRTNRRGTASVTLRAPKHRWRVVAVATASVSGSGSATRTG